jgi:hypothetical protein
MNLNDGRIVFNSDAVTTNVNYVEIDDEIHDAMKRGDLTWDVVANAVRAKRNNDPNFDWAQYDALRDRLNVRKAKFDLKDAGGNPLVPRKEPETTGRGLASKNEPEPDYRGVVGYMSLQTDWEVTRFSTFNQTPWRLPVYEEDGDGWKQCGMISHKTPVLVIDQKIAVGKAYNYYGYLKVVRLDTDEVVWINVTQFVTVPYWTLELREAIQYGYVIAVYRNQSKSEPTDRKKHRGPLPEGVRVLVGDNVTARYRSWDREHNPILGIVFRSNTETDSCYRTFLFFNPDDLIMIY